MVGVAAVGWYKYILLREKSDILKEALNFEIVGLREDAPYGRKWRPGGWTMKEKEVNPATSFGRTTPYNSG